MPTAGANDRTGLLKLPPLTPAADGSDTFDVLNWHVFSPGWWKGDYFSPARVRGIVDAYAAMRAFNPDYAPKAKLGHDREQRIALSMGLPNAGRVTDLRPTPDGGFEIDVRGIPRTAVATDADGNPVAFDLHKAFADGQYDGGSVEIDKGVPRPDRPTETFADLFTGVAFLGEEQPAVKATARPQATPATRPATRDFSAGVTRLCFSEADYSRTPPETPPMTRDQMIAALAQALGLPPDDPTFTTATDEQIKQAYDAQVAGTDAAAVKAMLPAPATPNQATGGTDMTAFMAEMKKCFSDFSSGVTKRLEAAEAAVTDSQRKADDAAVATQMSEAVRVVDRCVAAGKLMPRLKEQKLADLKALAKDTKVFSDGADKGLTAFQAELKALEARQPDLMFSEGVQDRPNPGAGDDELDEFDRKALAADPRGKLIQHHQKVKAAAGK